ncbi:unnamed protein product [Cladocopium goreaui]|uniref:Uncharacterized protein n=1 Tax=Cladocopium goreaui TaxID=2562237 RepID=A0A9P1CML6_9DINO|nr:unnamed protein product [Cladocopium goreaui]
MAFLWPISGEELLRLRREALPPVTFDGRVRRVQRLRPVRQTLSKGQEEAAAVARKLELLRWQLLPGEDVRIAREAKVNRQDIALRADRSDQTWLSFGDAIRVILPGVAEDARDTCLCTCVRPGMTSQVGPGACLPSDAAFAERRLARDLAAAGRSAASASAAEFVALTLAPVEDTRRSAWSVYRAGELDGFQDSKVHYGQPLLLGQPETTAEHPRQEVLLSCEPPSREGGIGAAYQLLGRFVGFGHAALDRKSWNTIFMLVPAGEKQMGDVVDVNLGLWIVPLAPFSYLHGPRLMQAMYFGLPNRVGRGCVSRALKLADGREELVLHAPRAPRREDQEGWWDAEWTLQPLVLPPEPCVVELHMTDFARWDRLRSSILERLLDRREAFAFSTLRKVLSKDRILPKKEQLALLPPTAEAATPLSDQIVVGKSFVASTFQCSYGLYISETDLQLLAQRFGSECLESFDSDEAMVNVDLFLDALRGEMSVGRSRTLDQLYTLLLKQVGKPTESLPTSWIQFHLEKIAAQRIRPRELGQFPPEDLMAALPLLRSHAAVTRQIFLRWQMDVLALVHQHEALLHFLREIWGDVVLKLLTDEEKFNWRLPVPQRRRFTA